jgi:hypothetical protein
MIEVQFGNSINSKFEEVINERAIEWNCSFELAYNHSFKNLLNNVLLKKNKDGEDYFDLSFLVISEKRVLVPKVKFSTYKHNSFKLPMLVLDRDYLCIELTGEKIYLNDHMLNKFGEYFEENFDYAYAGFVRR